MALSTVKKAFTAKPSYAGDPNCDFLAEACRKATAKNAYQPDENLKTLIVNKINETTPGAQVPIKVTYDIIRRRLQMENPHKQWLAVDLTRHLLSACRERLRPYRTELLYHVARVAIKPNKKGPITAQHNARKAATDYLHQCGDEGQNALRMARMQLGHLATQSMPVGPMGPFGADGHPMGYPAYSTVPPGSKEQEAKAAEGAAAQARIANVQQPTGDVMKDVRNLIDTAESHSNLLNELILAGASDGREANAPLLSQLKQEMLQVKDMFPRLLEQLSMLKTPGSEKLMAQALEAHEQIDQCLDMERQYAEGLQAEAELAKDKEAGHLQDDDDVDDEEVDEKEEGATGPGGNAEANADGAGTSADAAKDAAAQEAETPAAPAAAAEPAFDLLNFDSGPLPGAGADGNATGQAMPPGTVQQSDDLFGLGALQSNLPGGGAPAALGAAAPPGTVPGAPGQGGPAQPGHDDPFMSDTGPVDPNAAAAAAAAAGPPATNPFAVGGQAANGVTPPGGNPFAMGAPDAAAAANTPTGGAPSPAAVQQSPGQQFPGQPGQPGQYTGQPAQQQQFPAQQPGQQYPGQQFPGQQPGQQFPGQPGQFMFPGGPTGGQPGQFPGAGPTGPYMSSPQPGMPGGIPGFPQQQQSPAGYQMYNQQQRGWAGPGGQGAGQGHHFATGAFTGQAGAPQQPFPGAQQFPGAPPGQFPGAPSPTGGQAQFPGAPGAPLQGFGGGAANPFAPQAQTMPLQPGPQFGASATGMVAAPGYQPPAANPFAASSTGYAPSWNPNAHKDAFGDLIIEHNKRTNPTPAMTAPMRPPGAAGGAPNGLL